MARKNCGIKHLAPEKISALQKALLSPGTLRELAETFKVLGGPTRLSIIYLLAQQEFCVCDIASILRATNSLISHQLRVLRNLRLVKVRREGQNVFYSLDDDHIRHLFNEGLTHVRERE